jgi:hypothetical protein
VISPTLCCVIDHRRDTLLAMHRSTRLVRRRFIDYLLVCGGTC